MPYGGERLTGEATMSYGERFREWLSDHGTRASGHANGSLTFASWNQILPWLRRVDRLDRPPDVLANYSTPYGGERVDARRPAGRQQTGRKGDHRKDKSSDDQRCGVA